MRAIRVAIVNRCAILIACLIVLQAPTSLAHAASVRLTLDPLQVVPGDTVSAVVWFDPEGEQINAVEGSIPLPVGLHVRDITTAGSAFALWPVAPRYELSRRSVEFTGGIPGGLAPDKSAKLFSFLVSAEQANEFSITPQNVRAYRNDGAGTAVAVTADPAAFVVSESAPQQPHTEVKDREPPEEVYAEVGRDTSLFEGKYFLVVHARDAVSKIARVEIREGWWRPYREVAGEYYVLHDQTLHTTIRVRATDEKGNVRVVTVPPQAGTFRMVWILYGVLAAIVCAFIVGITRLRRFV